MPVDVDDIAPLSNCTELATIVFLDKQPLNSAVMAAFKLKQVSHLGVRRSALSKSQLETTFTRVDFCTFDWRTP